MFPTPYNAHRTEVYIIAEASGNHAQDLPRAHALIDAAATAGAQAIKFQTFTGEEIAAHGIAIARGHNTEHDAWLDSLGAHTLRDLFTIGGLPRTWHGELQHHAQDAGIEFLSTPFSVDAARFLVEEVGVPALKIASGDLTFVPLLQYANSLDIPIILSTGGATAAEVATAVQSLWHVYTAGHLALLHCRSLYPCPPDAAHLRSIAYLADHYALATPGWSDHTLSTMIPSMAVCVGARVIEKHLTLADSKGIDAGHSLTPFAFGIMVGAITQAVLLLGDYTKDMHPQEQHDRLWARRGSDGLRPTDEARAGRWA